MLQILWCFAHFLLILQGTNYHQNLMRSSLYHARPCIKFHRNLFITLWVMLLTNIQTNQSYRKHNLLCQGGNNMEVYCVLWMHWKSIVLVCVPVFVYILYQRYSLHVYIALLYHWLIRKQVCGTEGSRCLKLCLYWLYGNWWTVLYM